ncbi:hypothetical protein C0J52_13931 [Blattella germanica]|nr:hypothetical protein C0J52_13931 [Blattella germanica]
MVFYNCSNIWDHQYLIVNSYKYHCGLISRNKGGVQDCMQRKSLYDMTSRKRHHSAIFHVAKSQTVQRSFGPLHV